MSNIVVPKPTWVLNYAGTNISGDVAGMVESITYTDNVGHAGNDVEVNLEDRDKKWQGPWFPQLSDVLSLQIGYESEGLLPCGDFQVDLLELNGDRTSGDRFHLHANSVYITPALRTKRSRGYEDVTLLDIAKTIANKHGLSVVSNAVSGAAAATFNRVTQNHETDLAFLRRLAEMHNYTFNIVGAKLVFTSVPDIQAAAPVATITRQMCEHFHFSDITHETYKDARVSYFNPMTKSLVTATATAPKNPTGDTLVSHTRSETNTLAGLKAGGMLNAANWGSAQATLKVPGTTVLVAGNNVSVSGFGQFDGKWTIWTARHHLDRHDGYTTELEMRGD